jgi:hypothetical protein
MSDELQTANFDRAELHTLSFDQAPCRCVREHRPRPLTIEKHHVFPKGLQELVWGRVRDKETVPLCGNAHNSVHLLLDLLLAGKPLPAHTNAYHKKLAERGFALYVNAIHGVGS